LTKRQSGLIIMNEVSFIIIMSRRHEKKESTRQKLIEAASVEFAEIGYARANVSRISEQAGFATGTVYNYFRSKHELLIAVVEHAMSELTEEIRRETVAISDPIEKARQAIRADFRFMEHNEALSKVIVREGFAADPQRQREFLEAMAPASGIFIEILEQGKREGRVRADIDAIRATVLADGMVAYMLLARWALEDSQLTYDEMAELTIKCFIEGILSR